MIRIMNNVIQTINSGKDLEDFSPVSFRIKEPGQPIRLPWLWRLGRVQILKQSLFLMFGSISPVKKIVEDACGQHNGCHTEIQIIIS